MAHFFEGLVTELITSYKEDKSVDYERIGELVEYQLACGVKHLFINGLGGESHLLSFEERAKLLETVAQKCDGKAKIMACVFVATVEEGKKLIDMYEGKGYDALCFTAPPYFTYTEEALFDFTSQLLEYTDKPCYIYNCIQMATLYSPDLLAKLKYSHQNLYGYKDATKDIVHFMQCLMRIDSEEFDFLGGCDATIAPTIMMGACGTVSFMGNPFPKETKAVCDYALAHQMDEAMEVQYRILRMRNLFKQTPFNSGWMYAMEFMGGPKAVNTRMTEGMLRIPEALKEQIRAELQAQSFI